MRDICYVINLEKIMIWGNIFCKSHWPRVFDKYHYKNEDGKIAAKITRHLGM